MTYRRIWMLIAVSAILLGTAAAQESSTGSLGDAARQLRSGKKQPSKVVTNDDLQQSSPADKPAGSEQNAAKETASGTRNAQKLQEKDPVETFKMTQQQFRASYQARKRQVEQLQAELAKLQTDDRQRESAYYGDRGLRLRDERGWAEKQRKLQTDIAEKQKQIDAVKGAMEAIKEQAHRAGVPERILED